MREAENSRQPAPGSQHLTFVLGEEEYAVDILRVREIRSWEPVSRIPNVPSYEKGVINLRGAIVPILDLREKFEVGRAVYTPATVVIILQTRQERGDRIMGVVVDAVADVIDLPPGSIQPAPDFGGKIGAEFVRGIASLEGRMVVLLDVDRLLRLEERPSVYYRPADMPGHQGREPSPAHGG
jgi:purine-binding chemotaxis protein CheW